MSCETLASASASERMSAAQTLASLSQAGTLVGSAERPSARPEERSSTSAGAPDEAIPQSTPVQRRRTAPGIMLRRPGGHADLDLSRQVGTIHPHDMPISHNILMTALPPLAQRLYPHLNLHLALTLYLGYGPLTVLNYIEPRLPIHSTHSIDLAHHQEFDIGLLPSMQRRQDFDSQQRSLVPRAESDGRLTLIPNSRQPLPPSHQAHNIARHPAQDSDMTIVHRPANMSRPADVPLQPQAAPVMIDLDADDDNDRQRSRGENVDLSGPDAS